MLVAALTFGTAGWSIQPATDTATVQSVAGLSIDQFEKLQLPLLPLPGWEARARTAAISEWTASRQVMLGGSQPHALLVASRNEAEQGRYFEGVEDSLLGFAELGLLPAPPEQRSGWPGESRDSEEPTAAALTAEGASAATAAAASADDIPGELFPYLANLAVKAGARRLGLGKALVLATEQRAAELGYARMYIKVLRARERAGARRVLAAVPQSLYGAERRSPFTERRVSPL